MSDCKLLHDYISRFHDNFDSPMFSACHRVWMQKQALITVVSDHPNLEEFFSEFRHPGLSAGPVFLVDADRAAAQGTVPAQIALVCIVRALEKQHENYESCLKSSSNTFCCVLVVYQVCDSVYSDFLSVVAIGESLECES
jgi:hypothetical protein